ncbi:DUF3578 domain-containing protein [Streptomyces sp. NPDC051079]|uniref:MrcB family domain-containing protein n=1 Tax=Streptomyces sp. NPDC051079 TaxID=3155043 RepID=UPI00344FFEAC
MALRDLLLRIADIYVPSGSASGDRADVALLRGIKERRDLPLPERCVAEGFGGMGNMAVVPWIGVFDSGINTNPQQGLYLAYLFDRERTSVTLSLQQGVTAIVESAGYGKGAKLHAFLAARGASYRPALPSEMARAWQDVVHLDVPTRHWRPRAYEKANIAAKRYELAHLPPEEQLADDLREAVQLLNYAAVLDRYFADFEMPAAGELDLSYPAPLVGLGSRGESASEVAGDPLSGFKEGNSSDYYTDVPGGRQRRGRLHEKLVKEFAEHAAACGYSPVNLNVDKRDLVLRRRSLHGQEWLVEAKTVPEGKTYLAVRQAVAQLLEYRHFYYRERAEPDPHLVALFSASIGHYAAYLETLGITAIWPSEQHPGAWDGTSLTEAWELVQPTS